MKAETHRWAFKTRFRRHAFGWKSQPAIQRVKEAVGEIKKVAGKDPVLAGEGAVIFLERVSPALEHVDSSSGAIATAVNHAIAALVPMIARAPVDAKTREAWLERLWEAHANDQMPYIERLADDWGELCASKEVASAWADRLVGITRMALSPDKTLHGHFHGTAACLSALYRAERYEEIVATLAVDTIWPYKRWAVKALAAMGRKTEAIRYAESCRSPVARVWDSASGRLIRELRGHTATITRARFSPDGSRIVTANHDHTVKVWLAASGRLVATFRGHGATVWDAQFDPAGTRILSASADGTARIYDCAVCVPLPDLLDLARRRNPPDLSPAEARQFLH